MKISYLGLIFCFSVAFTAEFTWFEGKRADPCNRYLVPGSRPDCPPQSQLPASAVTVLIPSNSSQANRLTPITPALQEITVNLFGKGLPLATSINGQQSSTLALGRDGSCQPANIILSTFVPATTQIDIMGERLAFKIPLDWCSSQLETLDRPVALCWDPKQLDLSNPATNNFRYTGFQIGVVLNCDNDVALCSVGELGSTGNRDRWQKSFPLTPIQLETRIQRTQCCKSTTGTLRVGQCVNPRVQGCCGGTSYDLTTEKCCNPTYQTVVAIDAPCPCSQKSHCPLSEECCLSSKYPELNITREVCQNGIDNSTNPLCFSGRCYNPESKRCCDTGSVYDYGVDQCCPINGVQSLNIPCPCSQDSHCTALSPEHRCCAQTGPANYAENGYVPSVHCNTYQNYPTGTAPYQVQRCHGFCFDAKYAICCNGVACITEYERCCNSTCCNRFTGTCIEGLRPGARGAPSNPLNWEWNPEPAGAQLFQQCSTIEAMNTVKAFWVWVWPTMLLLVTLSMLSLSIVFSSKATPRAFSLLEYLMIFVAVIATGLSCPLFFAPVYKYGMFLVLVQMLVILTASARIKWLNVLTILVQIITLIYVFDPFHGNAFLNLSSNRYVRNPNPDVEDFSADPQTSGLLHAIVRSWHTIKGVEDNYCTSFYDWFRLDPMLRDLDRMDNPEITTFGYCSRGWTNALWFFAGLVMVCTIIQFILDLLGLFFRFHHDKIELEVHEELVY